MHFATQDGLELIRSVRVQVAGGQRRAEGEPGINQPAVVFHLIAADKQPVVRNANDLHGRGGNQRAVKKRGDAGQEIALQLVHPAAPYQPLAQGEGQAAGIVNIAYRRGDLMQAVGFCHSIQLR